MELTTSTHIAPTRIGRSLLGHFAFDPIAHTLARLGYVMPSANPKRHDVYLEKNVIYAEEGGKPLVLDVYMPRSDRRRPVVMYVHGGGFLACSKDTHRIFAMAIARLGYVVFNINYRQGPSNPHPAAFEDAAKALLWVKEKCVEYGGDPTRIAVAGESAGANLVTALAVAHSYKRPEHHARRIFEADIPIRAFIATYGLLDVSDVERMNAHPELGGWAKKIFMEAAASYVGSDIQAGVRAAPLSCPLNVLELLDDPERALPPFLVSCGTRDPLLPQSRRLKLALDSLGARCELLVHEGQHHAFDAFLWNAPAREKWVSVGEFLGRELGA